MNRRQKKSTKRKKSLAVQRRRQSADPGSRAPAIQVQELLSQGVAFLGSRQLNLAENNFARILRSHPSHPVALNCLAIVHRLRGKHEKAIELLRSAIDLNPEFAEAHCNLGNSYRDMNLLSDAIAQYERAIELKPSLAEAHNNLGVALLAMQRADESIPRFEDAIRINPGYGEAFNNLGNACRACGHFEAARESYSEALKLLPQAAEVHNNLANILRELGDGEAARSHYEQALTLQPDLAEAMENLGTVLVDLGDYDSAVVAYERSVESHPDSVDSLVNLGNAYKQQGRLDRARDVYQQAAQLEPDNRVHALRISALCPTVFDSHESLAEYRRSSHEAWTAAARGGLSFSDSTLTTRLVEPPFELQFLDGNLRELKEAYAGIFAGRLSRAALEYSSQPAASRPAKPRIGFVVTKTHEGIFLKSMRGVLERLRADQADLFVVCPPSSIPMIRSGIDRDIRFVPLPNVFGQMVRAVREASLDLLYYWEIGSDATNYFLPFLRLAPVQCMSWGVQVTSGIANIDYYLSSELVEPDNAQEHYSERLIRAETLLTHQFRDPGPARPRSRDDFGIPAEKNLYLCAQQLGKFHPDFDHTVAEILRRDPKGILVAIEDRHRTASRTLRRRIANSIPDVIDRILFVPRQNRQGYLSLIMAADVLLDPPHFGGVNTTYDAIARGKPIVTCPSAYHRGRYTLGCYRKMGIGDCVAADQPQFVEIAVELAQNRARRERIEAAIRSASAALFEDDLAIAEHDRLFSDLIDQARSPV